MADLPRKSIDEILRDGTAIDAALQKAFENAMRRHKQAGHPLVVWKDGQIAWIPPEEIPALPEEDSVSSPTGRNSGGG
jgi:hypothetical protein